jgi:hypothetical protein
MLSAWGNLVRNMNILRRLLFLVNNNVQGNQEKAEAALSNVEFAVAQLATKIGERPESLGTDSLYRLIEDMGQDVLKLQGEVKRLDSLEVEEARQHKLEIAIGRTVLLHLQPLVSLYCSISSTAETPGDLRRK